MGIRKKIFLGFVIIGFILFLSGFICIFQLVRIEKSASGILTDNIISINITKHLLDETESEAWDVFQTIIDNKTGADLKFNDAKFKVLIDSASRNITAHGEERVIKELRHNYEAFKRNSAIMDSLFALPYYSSARVESFNNAYRPSLLAFVNSVRTLREVNQEAISQNSLKLENNFWYC